ncbi:trypsin-like peptidase domain-containing protein [soil metagenome]
MVRLFGLVGLLTLTVIPVATAQPPTTRRLGEVVQRVNRQMVKIYGSGGFRGLNSYGTGIVVSPDGFVLTVASPMLDTSELRVHLFDGRRVTAKFVVTEPVLDAALLKIDGVEDLPFFNVAAAVQRPPGHTGEPILGFTNQFQIATREESMTVQRGVIASYTKVHGKRGVSDVPYQGDVYMVDAITNNPGAAGGALTTRHGDLLGLIGKELKNSLSETYINYAVPIQALGDFVARGTKGKYQPVVRERPTGGPGAFHGLILVPNVVERTPPFVENVVGNSPAAKAGLQPDDLIVYIDGEKITSIQEFHAIIDHAKPGTTVKLEIRRGDRLFNLDIKLDPLPPRRKS